MMYIRLKSFRLVLSFGKKEPSKKNEKSRSTESSRHIFGYMFAGHAADGWSSWPLFLHDPPPSSLSDPAIHPQPWPFYWVINYPYDPWPNLIHSYPLEKKCCMVFKIFHKGFTMVKEHWCWQRFAEPDQQRSELNTNKKAMKHPPGESIQPHGIFWLRCRSCWILWAFVGPC